MLPATTYGADTEYGDDNAADDLLKLWDTEDANEPSEDEDEENDNEDEGSDEPKDSDEDANEPSEEDEGTEDDESKEDEGEDDKDNKKKKVLDDNAVVKVKVGDTEEEVPVSKLTRLYGQEKALTQKSMEVAETRKQLQEAGERHIAAAEGLMQRAAQAYEPYSKVDWGLAVKELTTEEYTALRAEATHAYQNWKFYEQELDGYVGEARKFHEQERVATAQKTLKALQDPQTGIPGFNKETYVAIRDYAVANGMPEEAFGSIVDEVPLRLMHKAMLYDKGAKAVTKKVEKKSTKIVKARSSGQVTRETFSKSSKPDPIKRLMKTGDSEDAEAVLMARWSRSDD
jgi:hypothetical protein